MRFKLVLHCFIFISLVLLPVSAGAVTITKIGFVDISRVLISVPALQSDLQPAAAAPRRRTAPRQQPDTRINSGLNDLSESYYRSLLDELDRPISQTAITSDIEELLTLIQAPPEAAPPAATATQNSGGIVSSIIMQKIMQAVQEVGIREGYSVIVEKSNILYGHSAVDITTDVINELRDN